MSARRSTKRTKGSFRRLEDMRVFASEMVKRLDKDVKQHAREIHSIKKHLHLSR